MRGILLVVFPNLHCHISFLIFFSHLYLFSIHTLTRYFTHPFPSFTLKAFPLSFTSLFFILYSIPSTPFLSMNLLYPFPFTLFLITSVTFSLIFHHTLHRFLSLFPIVMYCFQHIAFPFLSLFPFQPFRPPLSPILYHPPPQCPHTHTLLKLHYLI